MASYLKKKPYVYKDCPGYIGVTLLYPYYVCGKRYHKVKRFRIPLDMDEKEREIFLRNKKREMIEKWQSEGYMTVRDKSNRYLEHIELKQEPETFAEVAKHYLNHKKKEVSVMAYKAKYNTYCELCNAMGEMKMKDLRGLDIQNYLDNCFEKGLTHNTVTVYFGNIKTLFNYAEVLGIIERNPISKMRRPKKQKDMASSTPFVMTLEQVEEMLKAIENDPIFDKAMIYVPLYTGMRIGEITGLKWKDIDFENRKIYVRRALHIWEGRVVEHSPKNGEQRVVPIFSDRFLNVLKEYKESLHEMERDGEEELVFMTVKDKPLFDPAFGKKLKKMKAKHPEIPAEMHAHAFRHTFTSIMINRKNVNPVYVAKILGHKRIEITLFTYNHTMIEDIERAVKGLEF